jgi:hypothetical protein
MRLLRLHQLAGSNDAGETPVLDNTGFPIMLGSRVRVRPPDYISPAGIEMELASYTGEVYRLSAGRTSGVIVSVRTDEGSRHAKPEWCRVQRVRRAERERQAFKVVGSPKRKNKGKRS